MRSLAGFVFGLWALGWAVVSGFVIGTVGVLPFALIPWRRRFRWSMPAAQFWARCLLASMFVRLDVDGEWPLEKGRGALIFCNHRSWLDPLILMAVLRSNGLSKSQILWLPFIGVYGVLSGAVFFNRNNKEQRARAREQVLELAEHGHRLQIFPEGTRSIGPGTREKVYLALGIDAYQRGIPLVPCVIVNSEQVLPPGRAYAWPGVTVRLRILQPVEPGNHRSGRDYAAATWARVRESYEELAP